MEYVSDRDSGRAMRNLSAYLAEGTLDESFWNHNYNIGGGASCRISTRDMYRKMYGEMYGDMGFTNLDDIIEPKWYATRNFHGQYYLDSDKLENYLHFRSDSMQYFYDAFMAKLKSSLGFMKAINKIPGGQKLMGSIIRHTFKKKMMAEHGTMRWIKDNQEDHIDAYWGSKKAWEKIPEKCSQTEEFTDWNTVVHIDHGYDELKLESELDIEDMKQALEFRGGKLLSESMAAGGWKTKLKYRCAFNHEFEASPCLVLEGGHRCPVCERKSWNYGQRAKVDPFFA